MTWKPVCGAGGGGGRAPLAAGLRKPQQLSSPNSNEAGKGTQLLRQKLSYI